MRKIDLDHYPRRQLYEVFKDRELPFFATSINLDATRLKHYTERHRCGFFVAISFLISHALNGVVELRHRIIEGELYVFDQVDPGFTVLLDDGTFSFCDARHFPLFAEYRAHAESCIDAVRRKADLETRDKHGMFFISAIPWFSFTAIVHPYSRQYGSIPLVSVGRYFRQGRRTLIPIAIQVHHGVVDGLHVGQFYDRLGDSMGKDLPHWLESR